METVLERPTTAKFVESITDVLAPELMGSAIDHMRHGIIVTDADGVAIWANQAVYAVSGYQRHELIGHKPGSILQGPRTDKRTTAMIRENLALKKRVQCDILNYTKTGEAYWIELGIAPVVDTRSKTLYFISIQKDISKKKVVEELLMQNMSELKESLDYGRRIQTAVMPDPRVTPVGLREWMVLYQPKSTLSGDFFWTESRDGQVFVAACDATGHGAPGALMATMGVSLLNQALLNVTTYHTDAMLERMHKHLQKALNRSDEGGVRINDTIDMALVRYNTISGIIEFSGAKRPLVVAGPNGVQTFEGDRISVGDADKEATQRVFHRSEFRPSPEETLYLFSDGVTDQFSDSGKKFSKKQLFAFLGTIYMKELPEQKQLIERFLADFQGTHEQLDDRLMIAFRV